MRFPTRIMLFVRFWLTKKCIMENLAFIKNKHSFRSCKGMTNFCPHTIFKMLANE